MGARQQGKRRLCPGISPGDGTGEGCPARAAFGSAFPGFLGKVGWLRALVLQTQVPSLGQEPPYLPILLTLQNLPEMLLDMEGVVVCWIRLFPFVHPEGLNKTSLFQPRGCRRGQAEGLERGNPVIKSAQDPWRGGVTPLGMEELFWKTQLPVGPRSVSCLCPVHSSPSLKVQINLFGWDLEWPW